MSFCTDVFGWGSTDEAFLESRIDEWDIDCEELYQEATIQGYDLSDINGWIALVYEQQADKVKEAIVSRILGSEYEEASIDLDEVGGALEEYVVGTDINYAGSSFDDKYDFWSLSADEVTFEDIKEFLEEEGIIR